MEGRKLTGELTDEALETIVGGMYARDGRMIVTVGFRCGDRGWTYWRCKTHDCGIAVAKGDCIPFCVHGGHPANCGNYKFCVYERGLWLCGNEQNHRR